MATQEASTIDYDAKVDAGYIRIAAGQYQGTEEIAPGIFLDYSNDNQPLGIEILDAHSQIETRLNLNPEPYRAQI